MCGGFWSRPELCEGGEDCGTEQSRRREEKGKVMVGASEGEERVWVKSSVKICLNTRLSSIEML